MEPEANLSPEMQAADELAQAYVDFKNAHSQEESAQARAKILAAQHRLDQVTSTIVMVRPLLTVVAGERRGCSTKCGTCCFSC